MMTGVFRLLATLSALLLSAGAAMAQAPASPELTRRAQDVVAVLRGEAQPETVFSPAFLAAVPLPQVQAVTRQLVDANGRVGGLDRIVPSGPLTGTIHVRFERATMAMDIALEPAPPHQVSGLRVTGSVPPDGDSVAALTADLAALPGQVSLSIARLGDGAPQGIAAHRADRPLAIGSTFKLFILAELSRQVRAGQRRWSDVVTIDRRSLPSGVMQAWPQGAPVTLHTLATMMISISDNTATDILLHLAGRENVERMMTTIGVRSAQRNRPFLSTIEAFALKSAGADAVAAFQAADEAGRRRLLSQHYAAATPDSINAGPLTTGLPLHIDTIEWFASADDLVRTLDWLRRHAGPEALAILAVNPGVAPAVASNHAYLGFKGGSEPGVINLSYLVRDRAGGWYAVTGSWNNPAAAVDEALFASLMTRAVHLAR